MSRLSLALVLTLLVAGCVAPATTQTPSPKATVAAPDWALKAMPAGKGHDHRNASQHVGLSTPNFKELAYDPLATDFYQNKTAVGYFCGGNATTSEGRKLTVISSYDSDVAFVLVDVTDAAHPQKVGEYVIQGTTHYDVDITPDGKYVVIGSDPDIGKVFGAIPRPGLPLTLDQAPKVTPVWRDACSGTERADPASQVPLAPATLLIDISDVHNPKFVDALPAPAAGPHSVSTATIDGVTYVASSITNLAEPVDYFQFSQIEMLPTGAHLTLLSTVDGSEYTDGVAGGGHVDAEIEKHPVTGKMVAYLSDWNGGMVVVDLSNPRVPMLLGKWADPGADTGAMHSTRSIDGVWNGHHYLIAGQEFTHRPSDRPTGWIYILDDTDPTNVKEVSRWTLPVDTDSHWSADGQKQGGVELFSTHYFRMMNTTLFVAMYHAGIWAVDLKDPAAPKSLGVFVPDKAPPAPRRQPSDQYDITPFVLDVFPNAETGTLTVFDGFSGVYSLWYDAAHPAPAVKEWPMSGQPHADGS